MADNGIECSVVMEKASFDPRAAFPDFKLVFANKGEKAVRLFDDFYPLKERGPNMIIKIWSKGNGKKGKRPTAWYLPSYQMERVADLMRFITLNPGEKYEVPVKDAYLLLTCLQPLASGKYTNWKYVSGTNMEIRVSGGSMWGKRILSSLIKLPGEFEKLI